MAKYKIIPSSRTIVQSPISIGHKAEKGVKAIEFDLTAWVETYGSGTATIVMKRWGDSIPYPVALEIDENNKATWTLSDIDTAKAGMAYAQLSYVVGNEVVKKSDIYTFRVMDSLTGEGDPPEAYESWLEHLTHLAAEAMAEVLDIEGIVTDKTLTVDGGIADAKAAGDALALKADKSTTYTKTEVDQMIEDVEVETDTTLTISGAAADAAETGRQIGLLKADLADVESSFHSKYAGTKISIIGDSISTFNQDGYKIPGYATYYPRFDVVSVEQTWWMKTINQSGAQLEINASYSGSRVTDTHDTSPDFYARTSLIGNPDLVFVALGTNDSINNVALGEYDYTTTYMELSENTFRTAYIKGIKSLQTLYPSAKIVCITHKMNDAYKESILNIANTLGCEFVDASDYVIAEGAHPRAYGMRQIAGLVLYPTDITMTQLHMAADAKKVGEEFKTIKTDIENINRVLDVDLTATLTVFGRYLIDKNGQLQQSAQWIAYKYSVDDFTVLRADLYGNTDSQNAIGFYSDEPSDATYLSGARFDSGTILDTGTHRAFTDFVIPPGAQYVLLTSRVASGTASITGLRNGLVDIIPVLDSRVTAVEGDISVLRETIGLADADSIYNGYYNKNAGFSGNANYRTYFFNTLDAIEIIKQVIAYTTSSVIPNIAYFSDVPPNANYNTCLSTEPLVQGSNKVNIYENLTVPSGCKCIAIINYNPGYETPTASMTRLRYDYRIDSIKEDLESVKEEIFSHSNIKAIYPDIWNANDFCIVGDEFWFAKPYFNSGDDTERCEIRKYHVVNGAMVRKGNPIYTDFGHWNCVDYCPETDTLVFGNGGNGTETTGNWFAIVPNASELSGTVALADVGIKYSVDIGFKVQAVWGDSNLGQYNVINLLADNATVIKKVLLTKTNGEYDGNYVVLESGSNETPIGVGGADVWGDTMYIGSNNFVVAKMSMTDYSVDIIEKKFYSADGTPCTGSMQGICVDCNYIWAFFNIRGATAQNYLIQLYR